MPGLTDHPERHQGDVVILRSWFQKGMLRSSAKQMIECARQDLGGKWQPQMIGMWIDAEYEMSMVCGGHTALLAKKAMTWSRSCPDPDGYKLNAHCPWSRFAFEALIAKEAERRTSGQSEATQADILVLRVWFRRGMLTGFCKKMMKHLRDQKMLDGKFWKDERITNFVKAEKKFITVHGGEEARMLEAANVWAGLRGNRNPDPGNWFPWDDALVTDRHTVIRVKTEEPVGFTFQPPITVTAPIEPKTEGIHNVDSILGPGPMTLTANVAQLPTTPQSSRVTRSMAPNRTSDQRTIYVTGQAAIRASMDTQRRRDRQAEIEELERREQAAREEEWNAIREARLRDEELEEAAREAQREALPQQVLCDQEMLPVQGEGRCHREQEEQHRYHLGEAGSCEEGCEEEHMQHTNKLVLHDQELLLQQEAAKESHDSGIEEDEAQELQDVQDAARIFSFEPMMQHQQVNFHVAEGDDSNSVIVDTGAVIEMKTQGQDPNSATANEVDPALILGLSEEQVQSAPVAISDAMATTTKQIAINNTLPRAQPFGLQTAQQARDVVDICSLTQLQPRESASLDQANALVPQTPNLMIANQEEDTNTLTLSATTESLGAAGQNCELEESLTPNENTTETTRPIAAIPPLNSGPGMQLLLPAAGDSDVVMGNYPVASVPDARPITSRSAPSTEVMLTVPGASPAAEPLAEPEEQQLVPTNKHKSSSSHSRSHKEKRKAKKRTRAALKAVSDLGILPQGDGTTPAGNITVINFHVKKMKVRHLFGTPEHTRSTDGNI